MHNKGQSLRYAEHESVDTIFSDTRKGNSHYIQLPALKTSPRSHVNTLIYNRWYCTPCFQQALNIKILMLTFLFYILSCNFQVIMLLFTCNHANKMMFINDTIGGRQDLHMQLLYFLSWFCKVNLANPYMHKNIGCPL